MDGWQTQIIGAKAHPHLVAPISDRQTDMQNMCVWNPSHSRDFRGEFGEKARLLRGILWGMRNQIEAGWWLPLFAISSCQWDEHPLPLLGRPSSKLLRRRRRPCKEVLRRKFNSNNHYPLSKSSTAHTHTHFQSPITRLSPRRRLQPWNEGRRNWIRYPPTRPPRIIYNR